MRRRLKFAIAWPKPSIARRLYFVVGTMGLLIMLELLTLRFAMDKLSAARAFVGAESLWSKAQKNAVFYLQQYGITKDEKDYLAYQNALRVPQGDHQARIELFRHHPNLVVVREGFIQGRVHPDDVDSMVSLLQRLYWVKQLSRAIEIWGVGDLLLADLTESGTKFHTAIQSNQLVEAKTIMLHIKELNDQLTTLEENFSNALGEGSRFVEKIVLSLLTIAVLMVEAVGLSLALLLARSLSKGLKGLNSAAQRIGMGDFDTSLVPRTNDEIGDLTLAVNQMGHLLKKSYGELDSRVQKRTEELSELAKENAHLYSDASLALRRRDEFLSLASHELKTPITSMLLQAQLLLRNKDKILDPSHIEKFSHLMERQLLRINVLVEEMLDTSRIDLSKFSLDLHEHDLSALILEIGERFRPQLAQVGSALVLKVEAAVLGVFDSYRIEQVLSNLLANAMKYATGTPVTIELSKQGDIAVLKVSDEGPGIAEADRQRIFNRFERGISNLNIAGLGIGLYITKAILDAHQGTITAGSGPKGGAEFIVTLPLNKSPVKKTA